MNKVILMGRMTKDPELKYTNNGTAVTSFTVAVNRQKKDDPADFINCVAWKNTAEFVSKYFGRGQMIALVGRWQTRSYVDKDGHNRTVNECVVDNVYFGGDKKKTGDFVENEDNTGDFVEDEDNTGDFVENEDNTGDFVENEDNTGDFVEDEDNTGDFVEDENNTGDLPF